MKKHIKKLIVLLIVVAIIITTFCIKVNATTKGVVTEEIVNVRQTPSKEAKIVMYISVNDKVEILEKDGDWYKIKYKNKEGYAFSDFIKVDEEVKTKNEEIANTTEPQIYVEAGTSVKITPNVASINIYTASEDASINVLEQINEWSYIEINNIKGWVRTDSVKDNANIQEETKEKENENEEDKESIKGKDDNSKETIKEGEDVFEEKEKEAAALCRDGGDPGPAHCRPGLFYPGPAGSRKETGNNDTGKGGER